MSSARDEHSLLFPLVLLVSILGVLTIVVGCALAVWGLHAYSIPNNSMNPTIWTGDLCLVEKFTYCFNEPKRGDIVVISTEELNLPSDNLPSDSGLRIRRIIGVPGDVLRVTSGRILVNGCPLSECQPPVGPTDRIGSDTIQPHYLAYNGDQFVVQKETYFLIGDQLANVLDSRLLGPSSRKSILGRVDVIIHSGHWRLSALLAWPHGATALQQR
jgi:signal peptidase I